MTAQVIYFAEYKERKECDSFTKSVRRFNESYKQPPLSIGWNGIINKDKHLYVKWSREGYEGF